MNEGYCPKYMACRLINNNIPEFPGPHEKYLSKFCQAGEQNWSMCKRYQTAIELGECPDFLLPDSRLGLKEIIDKMGI